MNTISDYTIYCTEEQTRKALKLGAPINLDYHYDDFDNSVKIRKSCYAEIPTAEQMIGFLRNKGILFHFDDETNYWRVDTSVEPISISHGVSEQKELAAIDEALEYLSNNKK